MTPHGPPRSQVPDLNTIFKMVETAAEDAFKVCAFSLHFSTTRCSLTSSLSAGLVKGRVNGLLHEEGNPNGEANPAEEANPAQEANPETGANPEEGQVSDLLSRYTCSFLLRELPCPTF